MPWWLSLPLFRLGDIMATTIVFKLSWGDNGHPNSERFFPGSLLNDAAVGFSTQVMRLDSDPQVCAAWVRLEVVPDSLLPRGQHMLAWTKTSNERPTSLGYATEEEALNA